MRARFDPHDVPATSEVVGAFDWAPSIERLEREYSAAAALGRADPWALVEAECWLDLVQAELIAARSRNDLAAISRLEGWTGQLKGLLDRLDRLANVDEDGANYFGLSPSSEAGSRAGSSRDTWLGYDGAGRQTRTEKSTSPKEWIPNGGRATREGEGAIQ
jgi:hypothetical protein